jgi:hypothetical protein
MIFLDCTDRRLRSAPVVGFPDEVFAAPKKTLTSSSALNLRQFCNANDEQDEIDQAENMLRAPARNRSMEAFKPGITRPLLRKTTNMKTFKVDCVKDDLDECNPRSPILSSPVSPFFPGPVKPSSDRFKTPATSAGGSSMSNSSSSSPESQPEEPPAFIAVGFDDDDDEKAESDMPVSFSLLPQSLKKNCSISLITTAKLPPVANSIVNQRVSAVADVDYDNDDDESVTTSSKPPTSSVGSKNHAIGDCKPCAWYHHSDGCRYVSVMIFFFITGMDLSVYFVTCVLQEN